jgi:hypothetical protein
MNFAEQTDFRRELHKRILEAVEEYEQQTGWQVKSIKYEPGMPHVATEVTEAGGIEISRATSPRSGTRASHIPERESTLPHP